MSERNPKGKTLPPWEALVLVAHYLDPQTLAIASCVSKSWSQALSLDLVWHPLCASSFPSLSNLKISCPSVPYRRLYAIGLAAFKRRHKPPSKPRLSIENLIFAIELSSKGVPILDVAEAGSKVNSIKGNQVFKFDIDVKHGSFSGIESVEEINITWNVVLEGWEAVFKMMDRKGKLSSRSRAAQGWFSEELPCPGCCSSDVGSGIVADLKLYIGGADMKVEKLSVGLLRIVEWRYLSIEDGLRYLQHFLLPNECNQN